MRYLHFTVIWQPYTAHVIESLPTYCVIGQALWHIRAPFICFELVEWHFPDRVMRQFGLQQAILENLDTSVQLHDMDMRGKGEPFDWTKYHRDFIAYWDTHHNHVVNANALQGPINYDDSYMGWFRRITRRFVIAPVERPPDFIAETFCNHKLCFHSTGRCACKNICIGTETSNTVNYWRSHIGGDIGLVT